MQRGMRPFVSFTPIMNIASRWFDCASLECSEISPVPALKVTQRGFPENFGIVVPNVPPAMHCADREGVQTMLEEFFEELLKTIRATDPKPVFVALPLSCDRRCDGPKIPDGFIKQLELWNIPICGVDLWPREFPRKVDEHSILPE